MAETPICISYTPRHQVGFRRKIHPLIPLYPGDLKEAWQVRGSLIGWLVIYLSVYANVISI